MKNKKCPICNKTKKIKDYYKCGNGFFRICKKCHCERTLKWKKNNLIYFKNYQYNWRKLNKQKWYKKIREWKTNNAEHIKIQQREYYKKNKKRYDIWRKNNRDVQRNWKRNNRELCNKYEAMRKGFGFNMLNKSFDGSVWHHINDNDVVAIPKLIHTKCYAGSNRNLHRIKVLKYYGSIRNMIRGKYL